MGNKSIVVTYLLWMSFGWLGIHHLYLRRYRHSFVWLWTLGGCLGAGWLLEFWRLTCYVDMANNSASRKHKMEVGFSWKRFTGELVFSMVLGLLSVSAIPKEVLTFCPLLSSVAAAFIAAGVHTAASIDHITECSYFSCLLGACVPIPILLFSSKLDTFITYSCLCSVISANLYGTRTRQMVRATGHPYQPWLCLSAANVIMLLMLTSALYHNCSVTTRDGVEIPLRDAFHNMLVSPAWADFRNTLHHLFHCLIHEGLNKFIYELRIVMDPEGENSAYKLLGFTDSSPVSEHQLTDRYRQLVRQYHPDKVRSDSEFERQQAEQQFVAIQQAYEKLSVIKRRRANRSDL